jgi:TonB family protein
VTKTALTALVCAACLGNPPAARSQPGPYYVPMRYIETVTPVFPQKVIALGLMRGEAAVAVQIDAEGQLTDYVVVGYSHPAFGSEAVAAIKQWKFIPALIRGTPVSSTIDLSFRFKSDGAVVDQTVFSISELIRFKLMPNAEAFSVTSLGQLDRTPTPTKIVKPDYVPDRGDRSRAAHVTVQFYIDEKGRVRLPAVTAESNASNEELAAAAITAVSQWRFEPPLVKGRPVLVLAEQDFDYKPATP